MPGRNPDQHVVTFCRTDADLADAAAAYLLGAIRQGGAGIAVVTPAHAWQIGRRIAAADPDPADTQGSGSYLVVDANSAIDQVLNRGWPDPAAFWRTISPVIRQAGADGQRPVRVCGEMVSLLWHADEFSAAIEVEALWNELGRQHGVRLLCAYLSAGILSPGDDSLDDDSPGIVSDALGADAADELALLIAAHTRIRFAP